jgi:DNA invertase Pin-like site-specific DNA recombinase
MIVGYVRVSTTEQNLDLQHDALGKFGVEKTFKDVASGAKEHRPGLDKCLGFLRKGDTIVIWKLDRLGRSIKQLIELMQLFEKREIEFVSIQDKFDTSNATGKLFYHIIAAFAEFERNLIIDRTNAGLAAARAKGRVGGRKKAMSQKKINKAMELYDKGVKTIYIAKMMKCSRATVYNYIAAEKEKLNSK